MNIDQINQILNEKSLQLKLANETIRNNKINIIKIKKLSTQLHKIKEILFKVGKDTQQELKKYIEETTTLALQSVYGEEFSFVMHFNYDKRDQFEVKFYIKENEILLEPRDNECSGGQIDVCAFALQMICLTLEQEGFIPILIQDEPFKNVSKNYIPAVGQMVKDICKLLNLQIIMVTHITEFIENADNVIHLPIEEPKLRKK